MFGAIFGRGYGTRFSRIRATRSPDARPMLRSSYGNEIYGPQRPLAPFGSTSTTPPEPPLQVQRVSAGYRFSCLQRNHGRGPATAGGSAAIIGVGGGRDLMAASLFNFRRIVGIELNAGYMIWLPVGSRVSRILTKFRVSRFIRMRTQLIFRARRKNSTSFRCLNGGHVGGNFRRAMTVSEILQYSGLLSDFLSAPQSGRDNNFYRWNNEVEKIQTSRLFRARLGDADFRRHSRPEKSNRLGRFGRVATILVSNEPFSATDLKALHRILNQYGFKLLFSPDMPVSDPHLKAVTETKTLGQLSHLNSGMLDFSPVSDSSPFFFNSLKLSRLRPAGLLEILRNEWSGDLRALLFLLTFLVATLNPSDNHNPLAGNSLGRSSRSMDLSPWVE